MLDSGQLEITNVDFFRAYYLSYRLHAPFLIVFPLRPRGMKMFNASAMILRLLVLLLFTTGALAEVPEGIPRKLARQRAVNISDVHYKLWLSLSSHATDIPGSIEITFALKQPSETLIDYSDGLLKGMVINGQTGETKAQSGHIILPAASLHAGQNTVDLKFTSHAGPAGKPIIQYEDKDDGSEYVYTLFVPMDASMAFPCSISRTLREGSSSPSMRQGIGA